MLKIKNVSANIDTTEVLDDITLEIKAGEIHAIMGPAKSGKSTLAHLIQGNPFLTQTRGSISFRNKDLKKVPAHKRSHLGIFTSFQHPVEIDGFRNIDMVRAIFEANLGKLFTPDIERSYHELLDAVGLGRKFANEFVNSGANDIEECRRNEIIIMMMIQPELIILDEIDLELSKEELERIAVMLKSYVEDGKKALAIFTHSRAFLDLMNPSHVHILVDGKIREQGTTELYKRIIEDGYSQFS